MIQVTAALHIGRRENNEDVALYTDDLFIVADGMGGHAHGEVAADLAVDTIEAVVENQRKLLSPGFTLREAIRVANQKILQRARSPGHHGMGTTVVALHIRDGAGAVAHVGDSRCYRLRDPPGLEQLTKDHSYRGSHLLERCLGGSRHELGDLLEMPVLEGDVFVLCSDGLNTLPKERVEAIVRDGGGAQDLIDAALAIGDDEQDNMAVLVVRITGGRDDEA